jgi:hypothetical protein
MRGSVARLAKGYQIFLSWSTTLPNMVNEEVFFSPTANTTVTVTLTHALNLFRPRLSFTLCLRPLFFTDLLLLFIPIESACVSLTTANDASDDA